MPVPHLDGKTVFITGAASGIGYATALAFAREGATIIATDLDKANLCKLACEVKGAGGTCINYLLDVTDAAGFAAVAEETCSRNGVPHVVINNAGIGYFGSFLDTPDDRFRKVMEVNVQGVVNGCRTFLPRMIEAGDDRQLVNVASLASVSPVPNMSAYAASKYAVDGLTEVIAMELQDTRVGVTCVHPGIINTPIVAGDSDFTSRYPRERLKRLHTYYVQKGGDPSVVADAIVTATRRGKDHLFVGPKARWAPLAKRFFPRLARRWLTIKSAEQIGYL